MKQKSGNGYTLIELLLAVAMGLLLIAAVYSSIRSAQRSASAVQGKVASQQDVRAALELMSMEIGMASYNPTLTPSANLWVNLAPNGTGDCSISTATGSNSTWKGIREANASYITIESDLNGDGIIGSSGQPNNEVIKYQYVNTGGDEYITRCSCCSAGTTSSGVQPLLGASLASNIPRTVILINDQLGIDVFTYYDGNGNRITDANLQANIQNIRRIDITLAVETQNIDPSTGQRRSMIYANSVMPINQAISP